MIPVDMLDVRPEVSRALEAGGPVVGLETAVVTHGLPAPRNLEAAGRMEEAVRREGAVPATVGVLPGRIVIGLSSEEVERLAEAPGRVKASTRDLAPTVAAGRPAGTTVAATVHVAARAGIRVVATGGIGGVHRDEGERLDISADLAELPRTPVAVVCSGPKAVLDLPRTLEALETLGVAVVGYRTDELPAFWSGSSGLALEHRVETSDEVAALVGIWAALGHPGGIVVAVPPPAEAALDGEEVERWVGRAAGEASARGIAGKGLTPYLLARVAELSGGRTLEANLALLERNAGVAAEIAAALAAPGSPGGV